MKDTILKTALAYALGSLIAQIINLIAVFIFMRELTLAEFGLYGLVFECFALLQMVVFNSFRNIYLQDFRLGKVDLSEKVFTQLTLGSIVLVLVSILCILIFKINLNLSIFLFLSLFLNGLSIPIFAKFLVENKRFILISKDILISIFVLATAYYTTRSNTRFDIQSIIIIQIIISGIVSFLFFLFYFKKGLFSISIFKFRLELFRSVCIFLGIFFINSFYNKMAVIAFNNFGNVIYLAIYLGALKFISPFMFVNNALVQAYIPKFISEDFKSFDSKGFFHFFLPAIFISICIVTFFPLALNILGLEKYYQSYDVVKILVIYLVAIFIYSPLSNFINVNGGQKIVLSTNFFVFLCYILFLFLLIKFNIFSPKTVAASYVFLETLIILIYCIYLKNKLNVSPLYIISPFALWACLLFSLLY